MLYSLVDNKDLFLVPVTPPSASIFPASGRPGLVHPWLCLRWACLLLVLLGIAAQGHAAQTCPDSSPEQALALVRETSDGLLDEVDENLETLRNDPALTRRVVDEHLSPHVDSRAFARLVLGKHWKHATPEQRERFLQEFHTLILRTYATALTEYFGFRVEYLPMRKETRKHIATVRTVIPQESGAGFSINYRLRCRNDQWKLFDVTIEGVSMVTTYRNAFAAEVKKSGIEGLIRILEAKNREIGA